MANSEKKQVELAVYEQVGFDPKTLTVSDIAFLQLCRTMRFGTFEKVGIDKGQPAVVMSIIQRIDLGKEEERKMILMKGLVPLGNIDETRNRQIDTENQPKVSESEEEE